MLERFVKIVKGFSRSEPVIHQYFMPKEILNMVTVLLGMGASRLTAEHQLSERMVSKPPLGYGVLSSSFPGRNISIGARLYDFFILELLKYNFIETFIAKGGVFPEKIRYNFIKEDIAIDFDSVFAMSDYKVSKEDAKKLIDDYKSVNWMILLSDITKGEDLLTKLVLAGEFARSEFFLLEQGRRNELTKECMAAINSNSFTASLFKDLFSAKDKEEDKVSELLARYLHYSSKRDMVGIEDRLPFSTFVSYPNMQSFFEGGNYKDIENKAMSRLNEIVIGEIGYFTGISPQERRYPATMHKFSEVYNRIKGKVSSEPFNRIIGSIEGIYKRENLSPRTEYAGNSNEDGFFIKIGTPHERAVIKLAYYIFRNCLEINELKTHLSGNHEEIGKKVFDYMPLES